MRTIVDPDAPAPALGAAEAVLADLSRAFGALRCAGSQRLVRMGVSMTHFHVLTILRHHDAMTMGRLAEILGASMSGTTGIVDRMEERGLVERVRVPDDRRIVVVRPTQAGLELVDEAELLKSQAMRAVLARLTPEQLDRLAASATDLHGAVLDEIACSPGRYRISADELGVAPALPRPASQPGPAGS